MAAGPSTPNPGLRYYYPVPKADPPRTSVDVCVYGGTPGGVAAAVQARAWASGALAVFRRHVGGMTSGGLTAMDTGFAASIGGIPRRVSSATGRPPGRCDGSAELGFRPSQAERLSSRHAGGGRGAVYFEHRLDRVTKEGNRITRSPSRTATGSRQGVRRCDLRGRSAGQGGRVAICRPRGQRDLRRNRQRIPCSPVSHQFRFPVDPYRVAANPAAACYRESLRGRSRRPGKGDKKVQAYNFRMWACKAAQGIPWPKPAATTATTTPCCCAT